MLSLLLCIFIQANIPHTRQWTILVLRLPAGPAPAIPVQSGPRCIPPLGRTRAERGGMLCVGWGAGCALGEGVALTDGLLEEPLRDACVRRPRGVEPQRRRRSVGFAVGCDLAMMVEHGKLVGSLRVTLFSRPFQIKLHRFLIHMFYPELQENTGDSGARTFALL
jgi:hypothetical protein